MTASNSTLPATSVGRIAITVDTKSNPAVSFEFNGNAQAGELIFRTALGNTLAIANWSSNKASLTRTDGSVQSFTNKDAMVAALAGDERLPIEASDAFLAWLSGNPVPAGGWNLQVLQEHPLHLIAIHETPPPRIEMRLILTP